MDRFLQHAPAVRDNDLMVSLAYGAAWQHDMGNPVPYDAAYFDKYVGYENTPISDRINAARIALVDRYVGKDAPVLDIGIGSGEFVKKRPNTYGFDVNPKAVEWLKAANRWSDRFSPFDGFTFWDVLEHVPVPEEYFRKIGLGCHLFTSLPIFEELHMIRSSKHYRPDEHFYYFTQQGFQAWMHRHGFRLLEFNSDETAAGREGIMSFAFERVR